MSKRHHALRRLSAVDLTKKVPIAGMRHPAGAIEMAIIDMPAALRFANGIEAEQYLHGFLPARTFSAALDGTFSNFLFFVLSNYRVFVITFLLSFFFARLCDFAPLRRK